MNPQQTIFAFLFALYFPTIVSITAKFQPFDTPSMFKGKGRAWLRFVVSMLMINIVPGGYFVLIYNWLGALKVASINFWSMTILILLSIAGFGLYRIYFGMMVWRVNGVTYVFYGTDFDNLPELLRSDLNCRPTYHDNPLPHIVPGVIWISVPIILGFLWTHWSGFQGLIK